MLALTLPLYAQSIEVPNTEPEAKVREHFFAAPVLEISYYGVDSPSVGIGLALGYGDGTAVGLRFLYAQSLEENKVTSMEITGFFRASFPNFDAEDGLFLQSWVGIGMKLF